MEIKVDGKIIEEYGGIERFQMNMNAYAISIYGDIISPANLRPMLDNVNLIAQQQKVKILTENPPEEGLPKLLN